MRPPISCSRTTYWPHYRRRGIPPRILGSQPFPFGYPDIMANIMRRLDWLFGRHKKLSRTCFEERLRETQENPVGLVFKTGSPIKRIETATPAPPAASPPASPATRTLAHSQLLSRFLRPANPDLVTGMAYLEPALGESGQSAVRGFIRDGLLEPFAPTKEHYASFEPLFKVAELKDMARERGLKLSGSKEELARRLLAADPSGISAILAARGLMQCSPCGVV